MTVAVSAVQGAFIEHEKMLESLGAECFELRKKSDLERPFDALVLPGGESTVMGKLLFELDMFDTLKRKIEDGMPVFGTCAGLILLSKSISNDSANYFATMDITTKRNAYGRQLGSFHTTADFKGIGDIPMTFIRAPYIESAGEGVEILSVVDGNIVAARQGNQLVTAFHPEVLEDTSVHKYFLEITENYLKNK
ncbi:MAG: pyridoxal 5'-phosphate synthase glutaminase subunit PdxT [Oscillospiraceae bacterium]|nr:pyridoxal 5'-phosphate synthase glutaminase subunit PdxT [Oscillospiraceae bacterium]